MDKNTIIGLLLMFLVIMGFTWLNQPSEAEIALRWYVGVSYMPECGLRASDPHPLLKSFIFEAAKHDR